MFGPVQWRIGLTKTMASLPALGHNTSKSVNQVSWRASPPSGDTAGYWPGFAWVSAGLLLNALLLTTLGFILSCTLCFTLAVRGLRSAEGRKDTSVRRWLADAATGAAIASPVYWMFTKLLAINLPGLSGTGWI